MGGAGLGFRATPPGAGFAGTNGTPSKPPTTNKTRYGGGNPLGRGFVPSSAAEPVLKEEYRNETPTVGATPKPSVFSTRGGGAGKKMTFAQKMMAKMGWQEGQGLGAEGQGRNLIIEQKLRPQGAGLGAVKEKSASERKEEKRQKKMRGEDVSDSEEEKRKRKDKQRGQRVHAVGSGTTSGASTPRRPPKPKFLTVNDIQKAAPGLHIPDAFAPILDLTGKDQKLLMTSSGLLTPTAGTEITEQTEARKLARRAQGDLSAFVEEWKSLEERKAWLDMESHQRQQELDELESDFSSLRVFSSVLEVISQAAADKEWDPVMTALKKVEATSMVSAENGDLAAIAVAAIHPFLRDAVQGWQPLEDPKLGNFADDLADIRGVLGLKKTTEGRSAVSRWDESVVDGTHRHHQRSTTPYESMIYKLVFPKLATTVAQTWDVFEPMPLLAVLERWKDLFPSFVHAQIIEQVVRRLNDAIASWKPRKKQHNLLHLWLFPWLEHLPSHHLDPRGTGIVADVRRKFRQLIDVWEFDRGVIPGLRQWKDVFRPNKEQDQWRPLVMHHILPGMARYLRRHFRVDPSDQEPYLAMLQGTLKWSDVISASMVAEVIASEVFPKWHNLLHMWLTSPEVNYVELGDWYIWWHDEALPSEFSAHPTISAEFEKGIDLIETALDLGDEALAAGKLPLPDGKSACDVSKAPHGSHHHHHSSSSARRDRHNGSRASHRHTYEGSQPRQQQEQPAQGPGTTAATAAEAPKTFRALVETWCQDNDLQFVPVRKANEQGRHYFRITARMDGKGGVLAHFSKDAAGQSGRGSGAGNAMAGGGGSGDGGVLVVESRKSNLQLSREKLEDPDMNSGGGGAEWTSLLDMLYAEA
ncbi:GC-rich sequence DNA-binding factor-like protein-domain-containing protein [Microdochium bolleyi]|uniref:GC-rich sequence DNA-binding factor-like protein-domain-containing protein n=1 Tax=Microdochium bolleyi TaxID=196109 RepID=A0A136IMT9_9PEZI|nr:GC-rich sequence DNA-binding factor-like protein-domain-containing protein [Microdochium bolleyi]